VRNEDLTTRKSRTLRTTGLLLAWTGLALLPLAATGCHKAAEASEKKRVVEVTTTNPQRKDLTRLVFQPGYLRPYEKTPIFAKIGGYAKVPQYDIGDIVKQGELLVELDVPEVVQEVNVKVAKVKQAEADLLQAKENALAAMAGRESARADVTAKEATIRSADAEVARWLGEVERGRYLLTKGIYNQQDLDQDINQWRSSLAKRDEVKANHLSAQENLKKAAANYNKSEADVLVAAANVTVAEAAHAERRDWLAYRYITAPYDGEVTNKLIDTGSFVQPTNSGSTSKEAEPLFVMMRTDIMRCTVEVPELDAMLIRKGDKAVVDLQAMPGVEMIGEVTRTTKALDPRSRTLRVEVHLRNPIGATVVYTASDKGVITSVDPTPPSGGGGYPPNSVVPLLVGSRKGGLANARTDANGVVVSGKDGIVNATTNSAGVVVSYTLKNGGSDYSPGKVTAHTISDSMMRANMYAKVSILPKLRNKWMLPEDAILNDILANGDRRYCFLFEEGKARKVFLEIGTRCEEGMQVLRMQRPGSKDWQHFTGNEAVIVTNNKALQDGQEVRLPTEAK